MIKMPILALETSCDETAAAILDENKLYSSVVYSQSDIHQEFGGVVPELASRAHLKTIIYTVEKSLQEANCNKTDLDAVVVTYGPGLVGALLVGLNFAKAMSLALSIPFLGINHLDGHLFANQLDHPSIKPPLVSLLVSGGHTLLVFIKEWGNYNVIGQSIDDAAGEAFDKVAKMLNLGYPGGPIIDRIAKDGDPSFHEFPRSWLDKNSLNFSFSGLKTSVLNYLKSKSEEFIEKNVANITASFQAAVSDVLVKKTIMAAKNNKVKKIALTGGVARNSFLRQYFQKQADSENLELYFPSPDFCTDNAAMIGKAGIYHLKQGNTSDFSLDANPNLKLVNQV